MDHYGPNSFYIMICCNYKNRCLFRQQIHQLWNQIVKEQIMVIIRVSLSQPSGSLLLPQNQCINSSKASHQHYFKSVFTHQLLKRLLNVFTFERIQLFRNNSMITQFQVYIIRNNQDQKRIKQHRQFQVYMIQNNQDQNIKNICQYITFNKMQEKHRIAIVNKQKCKPKRCKQQCRKGCPVNKTQKICIDVTPTSVVCQISEILCIGCGICVKKCPFQAIKIINLPKNIQKLTTHRYGKNAFKLHRLPTPRPGQILGLVGINGIGKSTALQILGNQFKPNLGQYANPPEWKQILRYFKGSQLQNYFTRMLQQDLKPAIKPQYVDRISQKIKGKVGEYIAKKDSLNQAETYKDALELGKLYERDISELSGGELQRFAMMIVLIQKVGVYIFDEPTSYLDVKQRIKMSKLVRGIQTYDNYIILVEHDLSILDYLSDFICCLYGQPTAYGVVTMPFTVREGINIFLSGFVPTQNMRFRDDQLTFHISDKFEEGKFDKTGTYKYPQMYKKLGSFELTIEPGSFKTSQITVMLGENGTGKTTFIKMLAEAGKKRKKQSLQEPEHAGIPEMNISYKPQTIAPKFEGTVRQLLFQKCGQAWMTATFVSQVTKPMKLDNIIDNEVQKLSGGQLQRVAIILALAKGADTYLIDEPSAYLDSQQRVITAKVIKRFVINNQKSAFIVEHDFIMSTYLADQVIVYEGEPGVKCKANSPQGLFEGMNKFLDMLQITFRRDPSNFRPRINKLNSVLDKQQKLSGNYFCLEQ